MAITIDESTQVITVEQSDLTLITGTLYEMDTNAYRLAVGALLASERYMWMDPAFNHNGEVSVAGTTFARIIEQTNGYSIEFEKSVPGDYVLRWDATTSAGIGYLTDEATNDVNSWQSTQGTEGLGTLTLTDVGVLTNYPRYVTDVDGHPCVHMQNDGGLWVADLVSENSDIAARIDDAVDVTVFIVSMLNNPTAKASNSYFLHGPQGARYANVGADESIDLYLNGAFRSSGNGWEDRRQICSHRNKHNGANDNDLEGFIGKDSLYSVAGISDASVAGPNTFTIGSYSNASLSAWDTDVNIYEVLIYGRAITDLEHAGIVDYLSDKWQATNENSGDDTISAGVAYSVRLAGSNNNLFDVENGILTQNLVQVIGQNAAGLVRVDTGAADTTAIIQSVEDWGVINYSK